MQDVKLFQAMEQADSLAEDARDRADGTWGTLMEDVVLWWNFDHDTEYDLKEAITSYIEWSS